MWQVAERHGPLLEQTTKVCPETASGRLATPIFPDGGYPYTAVDNPGSPMAGGTPCFSGNQDWTAVAFDLSAYTGIVQIMFRFGSDDFITAEGWYIDDISIGSSVLCGDANGDDRVNVGDAVSLISFIFKGGSSPEPTCAGNANGDAEVNVGDAVSLINYVFKGGPAPAEGCCPQSHLLFGMRPGTLGRGESACR